MTVFVRPYSIGLGDGNASVLDVVTGEEAKVFSPKVVIINQIAHIQAKEVNRYGSLLLAELPGGAKVWVPLSEVFFPELGEESTAA